MRARIRPLLRGMVERAQAQGALGADFTAEDVPLVFWTSGRVIEATASVAPGYWRRFLGLAARRAPRRGGDAAAAPPLTPAQLARATRRRERLSVAQDERLTGPRSGRCSWR